jgi:glycosyltransferase involved in cell wall biosynthesis
MKKEALRLSSVSEKNANRLMVIPNSVDVEECGKMAALGKKRLSDSFEGRRVVLYCGRLMANKGTDVLIDSIPRILGQISNLLFVFAGPGNLDRYARKLTELKVSKENFLFTGSISRAECLEIMGCSELLILPSFLENCPYAILEAMACGVPVVASDVGGVPEIIQDSKNGITFTAGSSTELSQKVILLLQNKDLQHRLSRNALLTVSKGFSWTSNLDKNLQAYETILNDASF